VVLACCGGILVAVDQHAADERVQLELLQHRLDQELQEQQRQQLQRPGVPVLERQLLSGNQQVSLSA
jgi:DNA mismatch repair ATPase MutL